MSHVGTNAINKVDNNGDYNNNHFNNSPSPMKAWDVFISISKYHSHNNN